MKDLDSDFGSFGDQDYDVVIAGAGFCGSMLAVQLAKQAPQARVALIEKGRQFGPGLAYEDADPTHLLNVPVGKMSAFPDDQEHFLRWLERNAELAEEWGVREIQAKAFVPRVLYGRYLSEQLDAATRRSTRLARIQNEVVGLLPVPEGGYIVQLSAGGFLFAKKVVLALGNFLPPHPPTPDETWINSPHYLRNPWAAATRAALGTPGNVVILGSGLTALDLLATQKQAGGASTVHIVSRHGLFAEPHNPSPNPPLASVVGAEELPLRLRQIVQRVRTQIRLAIERDGDWRPVVDGLRPVTQAIWQSLDPWGQRAFVRHVKPWWDIARHRAAPDVYAIKAELEAVGKLFIHRGRIAEIRESTQSLEITIRKPGRGGPVNLNAHALINASGPEVNYRKVESPLIGHLLQNGLIQPHRLGFGLSVTPEGQALNASGAATPGLFVLGSMRKGALWECTAVPELREQAADLAELLHRDIAKKASLRSLN